MRATPHLLHVFPNFGSGGTELRIAGLINALGSEFRHSIFPLNGNSDAASRIDPSISYTILQPPRIKSTVPFWWELYSTLRSVKPNLLATYNWGAIEAALTARVSCLCPVIHNESGFGPDEAIGLKRRRVLARRIILKRIYSTVVNSRTLERIALERYKIPPNKLLYIRNGVDLAKFYPRRNTELRLRLGVDQSTLLFGYLGKYRAEKNLALLLRAFSKAGLPNAKLALIGDGVCRQELTSLAVGLGIEDRVIFTGHVSDSSPFLQALDVFVLSSLTEQTPNALLEAMASGLPAICTNVGDVSELLGQSELPFIVPSGDVTNYAKALTALGRDPELRASAGSANRMRCIQEVSLDRMVSQFADLYRRALESG